MIYVSITTIKPRSIDKKEEITKSLNKQFEEYINILVEKRKSESINIDNINEEIEQLEKRLNKEWIKEHIINLYRIERLQTFPAYIRSAQYVFELLKSEGFDAEIINVPADGKTVYPMLRLASDTDDTYQPYAKTNKELTEAIGDLSGTGVTGDTIAAQIKALNDAIATVINA